MKLTENIRWIENIGPFQLEDEISLVDVIVTKIAEAMRQVQNYRPLGN